MTITNSNSNLQPTPHPLHTNIQTPRLVLILVAQPTVATALLPSVNSKKTTYHSYMVWWTTSRKRPEMPQLLPTSPSSLATVLSVDTSYKVRSRVPYILGPQLPDSLQKPQDSLIQRPTGGDPPPRGVCYVVIILNIISRVMTTYYDQVAPDLVEIQLVS